MDGKAFAWKSVTDSALTAELGRPFQRGITSGKKENLYALVRAKICLNLWGWLERLLLWAKVTDAGNVKWVQLCTALYIMVAAFRCRRTSRVSEVLSRLLFTFLTENGRPVLRALKTDVSFTGRHMTPSFKRDSAPRSLSLCNLW